MQVPKLKGLIEAYQEWLATPDAHHKVHYWETQQYWQTHWDADSDDWHPMFKVCLNNTTSRRQWKREAYTPKEVMLVFIELDPDFVRSMFYDLFNEEKGVLARADRFVFYCEQLWDQLRRARPKSKFLGHHHDDNYGIISLYLSSQYPSLYAPYNAAAQRHFLQQVGAANIPLAGDFERHVKLMRTLYNFLSKEEQIMALHQERLDDRHYQGESLLLAYDFVHFVKRNNQ